MLVEFIDWKMFADVRVVRSLSDTQEESSEEKTGEIGRDGRESGNNSPQCHSRAHVY